MTTTHIDGDRFVQFVIPAKAGTQACGAIAVRLGPRFRGDDDEFRWDDDKWRL
jgi:hypothetical protein